jgi:hypothetical protein
VLSTATVSSVMPVSVPGPGGSGGAFSPHAITPAERMVVKMMECMRGIVEETL